MSAAKHDEQSRFEAWRETATWYTVAKPAPDEDWRSDAATTFRLMNIAASEAWTAAAAGRLELLEAARTYAMRYAQDEAAEDGPEHTGCSEQQAIDARALFAAIRKATGEAA